MIEKKIKYQWIPVGHSIHPDYGLYIENKYTGIMPTENTAVFVVKRLGFPRYYFVGKETIYYYVLCIQVEDEEYKHINLFTISYEDNMEIHVDKSVSIDLSNRMEVVKYFKEKTEDISKRGLCNIVKLLVRKINKWII